MRRSLGGSWWLVATLVGCGDNSLPVGEELVHARDVAIVAHPEDDLVFMQPDLFERTVRGGTLNLYVASGAAASRARQAGVMAAYTAATGLDGWRCGWIDLVGHPAEHCRLADAHLSLMFLGYPEGDPAGTAPTSLTKLWDGTLEVALSIGDRVAIYSREDLVAVIAEVLDRTAPRTVRTLELAGTHGGDHADHVITGAAALVAIAASSARPELIAFRGESTEREAPNVIEPLAARSAQLVAQYDQVCGPACPPPPERALWLHRRYAIAMRRTARGALRAGERCVELTAEGELALGACTDQWRLGEDGTLRAGERCVELTAEGELAAAEGCEPAPPRRFFLDDEGHLWLGAIVPASPGGPLRCVVLDGDRVRADRCGPEAPVWELSPSPTRVPRPANLAHTGRAVRLADLDGDRLADLCEISQGQLACARGDGAGGFAAAQPVAALPVEPESLVIGDVDGDGLPDACGRDAGGLLCAIGAGGTQRWSPAFARSGPADATDRSLAAVDADDNGSAEVCGLSAAGVVCATQDPTGLPEVRSAWPAPGATLWPGDLDGDRRADWCAATEAGAACGLDLLRPVTSDGVPWSFSLAGTIDPAPADAATGALADIDGDGRDDLCSLRGRRIACARSQGFGFGPAATLATLPPEAAPTALWLGDLDGDGIADACVEDAGAIRCVRSP